MTNDRPEPSRPEEPDKGLDVDAAFADIVAHWEPSDASTWPEAEAAEEHGDDREPGTGPAADRDPERGPDAGPDAGPDGGPEDPDGLRRLFNPGWTPEPAPELRRGPDTDGPDPEEEHFVPPPPPPLPPLDSRRKIAWTCLVGTPVVALVLLVAGVVLPQWMAVGLVLAFVGGFGYLVATMGSSPPDDWSGGDGAVL